MTFNNLPSGWAKVKIKDVALINPRHDTNIDPETEVSFIRMSGISTTSYKVNFSEVKKLSNVRKNYSHFAEGDVLFAKITPCMENGKAAITNGLKNSFGCGSTEFHVLRAEMGINTNLLYYYLHQESFRGDAQRHMTGTSGHLRVPVGYIKSAEILLAPENEQQRIVAKLEKLMAKVDQCKARLKKIPFILKRFRQSVLAAACSGELTKDWREKQHFERDYSLSELSSIVDSVQIGPFGSLIHKSDYVDNKIPLINPTNIVDGRINPSTKVTIREKKRTELGRYVLKKGDVIVGRRGEMGRCAVIREEESGWICGTGSLFIRPGTKIIPEYLQIIISSPPVIGYLGNSSVGSTMTNLNQKILAKMEIDVPEKVEQEEIVRVVESLFKIADQIESRYKKAKAHVDKLTQSILAKAFRGELVPQDPNDEPASKLLERIREGREKRRSEGKPKRRHKKTRSQKEKTTKFLK